MEKRKKVNILFYISTIVIMLMCTLSHFLYKWSNFNYLVAYISPVNESIFQHVKMFCYMIILYYFITYLIFMKKFKISANKYIICPLISIFVTSFIVISLFYVFKYAFNYTSMGLDLLSLILGLFISSLICKNIYHKNIFLHFPMVLSLIFIFMFIICIIYLDLNPIHVDLFYDHVNKTYDKVMK